MELIKTPHGDCFQFCSWKKATYSKELLREDKILSYMTVFHIHESYLTALLVDEKKNKPFKIYL